MNRLRMWCALFFVWLFVLYNIERLHEPFNLASFVYVLAAAVAIPVTVWPRLHRVSIVYLLAPVVPLTIATKWLLGYHMSGPALPWTVTEIVAIWTTIALALQLGRSLEDLRHSAVTALLAHLRHPTATFDQGQAEFYREVSRARRHRRPLALLAISVGEESVQLNLDRFTRELQQECLRNYVYARIAELLSGVLKDSDVISQRGDQLVTVVPEADRQQAQALAVKLKRTAMEKLGVDLDVGISLFPDDEVTFVKLLERAEVQVRGEASRRQPEVAAGPETGLLPGKWLRPSTPELEGALDGTQAH